MNDKKMMHIRFWKESSDDNFNSMLNIFKSGEYSWSLFIGHLSIEKLLKAIYVKKKDLNVPRVHDLLKIAKKAEIDINEDKSKSLQYITLFNIETRYFNYKKDFKAKCTKEYTERNIKLITEIREWLLEILEK